MLHRKKTVYVCLYIGEIGSFQYSHGASFEYLKKKIVKKEHLGVGRRVKFIRNMRCVKYVMTM